jgi:hypothetical protein
LKIESSPSIARITRTAFALLTVTSIHALAQDTIVTDRPGLSFSPVLVPTGRFQAELGLPNLTLTRGDGVDTEAWNTPLQLRYGLTSSLELRLGSSLYNISRDNNARETSEGFGDAEIGAKVALCEADGARPKAALVGGVRVPIGADEFTSHEMGFNLNLAASWAAGEGNTITGLAGFARTPIGGDDATNGILDVVFARTFDFQWSGYCEAAYLPGFHSSSDQAYVGAGVALLVANDVQLDASGDFGINDASSDAIVGLGISWRL